MSREIPDEPYKIDPRFKAITTSSRNYSEDELKEMGFEKINCGNYVLSSQNPDGSKDLSGIFIIMEENEEGRWRVAPKNLRVLLYLEGLSDRPIRDPDEQTYFYQKYENLRREEERRRGLAPGSLIHKGLYS